MPTRTKSGIDILSDDEKGRLRDAYDTVIRNYAAARCPQDIKITLDFLFPDLEETLQELNPDKYHFLNEAFAKQAGIKNFIPPEELREKIILQAQTAFKCARHKLDPNTSPTHTFTIEQLNNSIIATWEADKIRLSSVTGKIPHGDLKGINANIVRAHLAKGKVQGAKHKTLAPIVDELDLGVLTLDKLITSMQLMWNKRGIRVSQYDESFTNGPLKGWIAPKAAQEALRTGCLSHHGYRSLKELADAHDIGVLTREKILIAAFLTWQDSNFNQRSKKNDGFFQHGPEAGSKFKWMKAHDYIRIHDPDHKGLADLMDDAGIINGQEPDIKKMAALGISIAKIDDTYHAFPAAKEEADPQLGKKKRRVTSGASPYVFHPY